MKIATIALLALAGLIHLFISPDHYGHAPAHGIFFALSGAAQLGWAIMAWFRMNRIIYYLGLALSGGMVILWLLTQLWTPPFAAMAEPVDIWMITSKIAEVASFFALLFFGGRWLERDDSGMKRQLLEGTAVAAIAGLLFYGGGYAAEPMLPTLQHAVDEAHDNADGHHDDEADTHVQDEADHENSDEHHDDEADTHAVDEESHDESDGHHDDESND